MTDPIRMGGLISGTDVQGIIDQLLQLKTKRIDAVQEQKVELQTDVAVWMDVNSHMSTLTDAIYRLRTVSTWRAMAAVSSDSTKLSATATRSAADSVYNINIINRAAAHSVASDKFDSSTDLVDTGVLAVGDTFTIGDPAGSPQTVTIGESETLLTLSGKINDAASSLQADERVFAQAIDGQLVITRSRSGSSVIQLENTSGEGRNPLDALGIGTTGAYVHEWAEAADASFTINGSGVITRAVNTNINDVIEGVTFSLLADSGSATLTVSPDTEVVKGAIVDFVAAYNEAIGAVRGYSAVDMTDPYNPLTGPLQGDTLARAIPTNFRQLATSIKSSMTSENSSYTYAGHTGVLNSLQGIGIWTGGAGSGPDGTGNALDIIDEDRLDYMLSNYYDLVEQVFMGVPGSDERGVARDLYDYSYKLSSTLTGDIDVKIKRLAVQMESKTQQIDKMFDDLDRYERRLWRDFTAMEDAIARMQQDLGWLVSQTGLDR